MKKYLRYILGAVGAAAVGAVCGFFGGGGGMLAVPILRGLLGLSVKESHATAIAVILPAGLAGAVSYAVCGNLQPLAAVTVSGGCVLGGIAGALLLKVLPGRAVAVTFALITLAVGIKLAFF